MRNNDHSACFAAILRYTPEGLPNNLIYTMALALHAKEFIAYCEKELSQIQDSASFEFKNTTIWMKGAERIVEVTKKSGEQGKV